MIGYPVSVTVVTFSFLLFKSLTGSANEHWAMSNLLAQFYVKMVLDHYNYFRKNRSKPVSFLTGDCLVCIYGL